MAATDITNTSSQQLSAFHSRYALRIFRNPAGNPDLWLSVEDDPTTQPTVTASNATYVVPGGSYVELSVPNQVWGRLASAGTAKLTTLFLPT